MSLRVGLIYNEPVIDRYTELGEADAITDVLEEVNAVEKALAELGHEVVKQGLLPPFEQARQQAQEMAVDTYFNLFEGFAGRPETEAMMAAALAVTGRPYSGSDPSTLTLALDKVRMKELLLSAGILTPRHQVLTPGTVFDFNLTYPAIVKPVAEDASHGITEDSVVKEGAALRRQVEKVCTHYGGRALVEEFIDGRELSTTIMGNYRPRVLSISEIVFSLPEGLPRLLTFGAKWTLGDIYFLHTDPVCPAQVEPPLWEHVAATSLKAYRLAGCRGYARVDMRVDEQGRAWVLEVNPNPDISITAGAARQAAAIGLTYPQFIDKILALARGEE
jgi:D-alanine-D-alanine ligase